MPAGDSKIKFTVEGITQLHQSFQSILNDSKALTEEWTKQGTSVVKSLQEQIELLKKRNSIAMPPTAGGQASSKISMDGGSLDDIEAALESMVTDGILLHKNSIKDLADLIKLSAPASTTPTAGGQASSKTQSGQGTEEQSEMGQVLGKWAFANMLRPIQSRDPFVAGLGMGGNLGAALMSTGNPYALAGGAVLSLLTGIIGAKYQTMAQIAPIAAQAARQMGGTWQGWTIPTQEGADYGLTRNEVLQRQMEMSKAMGRTDVSSAMSTAMLWESTTNLSSADIASFARSARGDRQFGLGQGLAGLVFTLRQSGVSQEKIQAQMSEYLREIASLNQQQLELFGKSDTGFNEALFSMVAKALPQIAESNPALVSRIAGSLYQGMVSPASRQIEALQYQTAARVNPNASWYQIRTMTQDPFGHFAELSDKEKAQRQKYVSSFVENLRGTTSSRDEWAYMLEKQFGLSSNVAWQMSGQETIDIKALFAEAEKAKTQKQQAEEVEIQLRQKLPATVDAISQLTASWEKFKVGENIETITGAVEAIKEAIIKNPLSNPKPSALSETVAANYELADKVGESGGFWNGLKATSIESAYILK